MMASCSEKLFALSHLDQHRRGILRFNQGFQFLEEVICFSKLTSRNHNSFFFLIFLFLTWALHAGRGLVQAYANQARELRERATLFIPLTPLLLLLLLLHLLLLLPLPLPLITIIILSACEGLLSADVCFIAGETPSWQLLFLSLKVTAVLPLFAGYSCIIMMLLVFFWEMKIPWMSHF